MSNREIKFRAWNGEKMITQFDGIANIDTFNTSPKKQLLVCIGGYSWGTANWGTNVILEQYTGLKDRNGVEIYEGDVLEYISSNLFSLGEKIRLSVSYVQARFWCHGVNNGSNIGIYLAELIDTEKCKVIGNIHQNSELL